MNSEPVFSVNEFVAYINQTLEFAYPFVTVQGELSNVRVSKNKWVYFDLKDDAAVVRCFATVYVLRGPLEDGMVVRVSGSPRLHPLYNFTFTAQTIVAVGAGALRRQADLLRAKFESEGLFDISRKRKLPMSPRHIALVASQQSAAYADFMKVARHRWGGVVIDHYETQVQGELAPGQIVQAVTAVNALPEPAEVLVITRGGGSAEDLAAFNDERVVRAVAASRVPTLVAIGHEIDTVLAELAADVRASTPSNAAEVLFPDKKEAQRTIQARQRELTGHLNTHIMQKRQRLSETRQLLNRRLESVLQATTTRLRAQNQLLTALDPHRPLEQGYALIYGENAALVRHAAAVQVGEIIDVEFADGRLTSRVASKCIKEV